MKHTMYLIVDSGGNARVRKSAGSIALNEVAFKITVEIPTRREVLGDIMLSIPEPPDAGIEIDPELYGALIPRAASSESAASLDGRT